MKGKECYTESKDSLSAYANLTRSSSDRTKSGDSHSRTPYEGGCNAKIIVRETCTSVVSISRDMSRI